MFRKECIDLYKSYAFRKMGISSSSMKVHEHIYGDLIAPENLFRAWEEFRKGKTSRVDVQVFEWKLEENVFGLHRDLSEGTYRHGGYEAFTICDPKQRLIHKATVRDRVVHHAVFATLNPVFEPTFIAHSFSCRVGKGTHKGVDVLRGMLRAVSRNHTRPCFALKCDIRQFFASVDHAVLSEILSRKIQDELMMELVREIVGSFASTGSTLFERKGVPIGNLTSQLFANVYMNEFDQFVKHSLRVKHFVRYTDDFVIVSDDEHHLQSLLPSVQQFLSKQLRLNLHPHKVTIRKFAHGVDFLGYVLLPQHRAIRITMKRRMLRKLDDRLSAVAKGLMPKEKLEQSLQSYLGVLSHADCHRFGQDLQNRYWVRQ